MADEKKDGDDSEEETKYPGEPGGAAERCIKESAIEEDGL